MDLNEDIDVMDFNEDIDVMDLNEDIDVTNLNEYIEAIDLNEYADVTDLNEDIEAIDINEGIGFNGDTSAKEESYHVEVIYARVASYKVMMPADVIDSRPDPGTQQLVTGKLDL
jgi:hypothetical protein